MLDLERLRNLVYVQVTAKPIDKKRKEKERGDLLLAKKLVKLKDGL